MGEQTVDLRATWAALRRHSGAIALIGLLGAILGAGLPLLRPPMYTSTSEVLLPTPVVVQGQEPDPQTQVEIAASQSVLGVAGRAAAPELPFDTLVKRLTVSAPSDQTLRFDATAPSAARAEALATAAARAELAYVARTASTQKNGSVVPLLRTLGTKVDGLRQLMGESPAKDSPQLVALGAELATVSGQLGSMTALAAPTPGTATIIESASPASRPTLVSSYGVPVGFGLIAGLVVASIATALLTRGDRRLRSRDQLALAVGSPVLASMRGRWARSVGGWHHLVAHYEPSPVDAWALRQVLRAVPSGSDGRRRITVVGLDTDGKGTGFGPLLSSYAAGTGVRSELVVDGVAAGLSISGALRRMAGGKPRPDLTVTLGHAPATDAELVVVVTSAEGESAGLTGPALIAVSAGAVTAKRLARAALATDQAGGEVIGVVVVDPDPTDRTSGRLMGRGGEHRRDLPLHVPGVIALERRQEQGQ